jgi:hypothetical protein
LTRIFFLSFILFSEVLDNSPLYFAQLLLTYLFPTNLSLTCFQLPLPSNALCDLPPALCHVLSRLCILLASHLLSLSLSLSLSLQNPSMTENHILPLLQICSLTSSLALILNVTSFLILTLNFAPSSI